jgi:DNA-binding transcriptional LysR family regulator
MVSNQVQALEDSLGVRLLNRTTRRVGQTEIGREYYERCSQILQELAEADKVASALQVNARGRLRLDCQPGLDRFFAPVATRFLADYPEVSLDFHTGPMIDLVPEGFDLAIMRSSRPDSTLIKRTLAKWHYLLCCAPAYLETHSTPRCPPDLHNCLLYAYLPRVSLHRSWRQSGERSRVGQAGHLQHYPNAHSCRCRPRIVAVPPVYSF